MHASPNRTYDCQKIADTPKNMAEITIVMAILKRLFIGCLRILLRGGKPAACITQVADRKYHHDQEKYC